MGIFCFDRDVARDKACSIFVIAVLITSFPAWAQEPSHCTPVHFVKGAYSSTVSGIVGSDEPFPCYTFNTTKGQTASLKFSKTNGNMAFTIYDLVDDQDSYSFKTLAKIYKFSVFQTMRATPEPFSLVVFVK